MALRVAEALQRFDDRSARLQAFERLGGRRRGGLAGGCGDLRLPLESSHLGAVVLARDAADDAPHPGAEVAATRRHGAAGHRSEGVLHDVVGRRVAADQGSREPTETIPVVHQLREVERQVRHVPPPLGTHGRGGGRSNNRQTARNSDAALTLAAPPR